MSQLSIVVLVSFYCRDVSVHTRVALRILLICRPSDHHSLRNLVRTPNLRGVIVQDLSEWLVLLWWVASYLLST